jgi:pimeloyl-ACP methyl ester carboxylesterase
MKRVLKIGAACLLALAIMLPTLAQAGPGAYATLDGHKVFYTDQGQGGPALVLIHGWLCNQKFWREQVPALSKSHRVIALDMLGFGQSDAPRVSYTQELLARSVLAVMDRARVESAVLMGHSMGAAVARLVALRHPARVVGIISMDGALDRPPQDPSARQKWLAQAAAFGAQFAGPDGQDKVAPFFAAIEGPNLPPALAQWILAQALATPWHVGQSSMADFIKPANWDMQPSQAPALAIVALGPHVPPDHEQQLRGLFPNLSYRTVYGVGHFLMLEKPEAVNPLVLEFVDGQAVKVSRAGK